MTEELAFEQSCRNGGAVELHESIRTPGAEIMDCTRDQFFPCPGCTIDKHGGVRRCDNFDLHEHPPQRHALPYDFPEVQFTADFILQIKFFLRELVLERLNLAVGKRVLHGQRYLVGHLPQELDIFFVAIGIGFNTAGDKAPDASMRSSQRKRAEGPNPMLFN